MAFRHNPIQLSEAVAYVFTPGPGIYSGALEVRRPKAVQPLVLVDMMKIAKE